MKELSVFVDESGDFGEYSVKAPYYIISLIFHDQSVDLSSNFAELEKWLAAAGFSHHCTHAGPIIRREEEYQYIDLATRQRLLKRLMAFVRMSDICIRTFYIEKRHTTDSVDAAGKLSKQLSRFIRDHYSFLMSFDRIKVYYDNGQIELTHILSSVFNSLLDGVEFKRVLPSEYRLFQIADLVCSLKLTELKAASSSLSKSEEVFFGDLRTLRKNYLKPLSEKELK